MKKTIVTALMAAAMLASCVPKKPLYYPAARWMKDDDRRSIEMPKVSEREIELDAVDSDVHRDMERLLSSTGAFTAGYQDVVTGGKQEALNVNNFDEVADSSWFQNRIGRREMTIGEMVRGTEEAFKPGVAGPLEILSAKTEGVVPRIFVKEAGGRRFMLRFERPGLRGVGLGAEIVSSAILNAAGYNLPKDALIELDTSRLVLGKDAKTRDRYGEIRPMTDEDLKNIVAKITGGKKGLVRAVSSAFFKGEYIGPFDFSGRRRGDKNDRIPHQHRRELRGYQMFCALLNILLTSSSQTADIFLQTDGGKGYVEHYLFDLSSAFGGVGSWFKASDDNEESVGARDTVTNFLTLGIKDPGLDAKGSAEEFKFMGTGPFDPGKWSPRYNNEAFAHMTSRDAFWAARILMRFSDDAIAAIVDRAGFPDAKVRDYVKKSLIARRDAIGRYAFSGLNPLDGFAIAGDGGSVSFSDLSVEYGFAKRDGTKYRYSLESRMGRAVLAPWAETRDARVAMPGDLVASMDPSRTYVLKIQTKRAGEEWWSSSVDVFLKRGDGGLDIQGIDRRYGNH